LRNRKEAGWQQPTSFFSYSTQFDFSENLSISLCAVSAINSEKLQFKEFVTKRELERIRTTDFLTNTANRLKISEEAKAQMDFCKQQNLPLSLVFFDVDNLKLLMTGKVIPQVTLCFGILHY